MVTYTIKSPWTCIFTKAISVTKPDHGFTLIVVHKSFLATLLTLASDCKQNVIQWKNK